MYETDVQSDHPDNRRHDSLGDRAVHAAGLGGRRGAVPTPQPEPAKHLPVRHGQAGHRSDRPEPAAADRHSPVLAGVPAAAAAQDEDDRADELREAACGQQRERGGDQLQRLRHRRRGDHQPGGSRPRLRAHHIQEAVHHGARNAVRQLHGPPHGADAHRRHPQRQPQESDQEAPRPGQVWNRARGRDRHFGVRLREQRDPERACRLPRRAGAEPQVLPRPLRLQKPQLLAHRKSHPQPKRRSVLADQNHLLAGAAPRARRQVQQQARAERRVRPDGARSRHAVQRERLAPGPHHEPARLPLSDDGRQAHRADREQVCGAGRAVQVRHRVRRRQGEGPGPDPGPARLQLLGQRLPHQRHHGRVPQVLRVQRADLLPAPQAPGRGQNPRARHRQEDAADTTAAGRPREGGRPATGGDGARLSDRLRHLEPAAGTPR